MAYYAEKDFFEDDELIQLVTSILEGNLTLDWYRVDTPRVRARPADPGRGLTYEDCNLGPYGYDVIPEFLRDRYSMASRGSALVAKLPDLGYTVNRRSDVWADNVAGLYEEAKARRWAPAVDIPWGELDLVGDPLREAAMAQACTLLEEVAPVASSAPSRCRTWPARSPTASRTCATTSSISPEGPSRSPTTSTGASTPCSASPRAPSSWSRSSCSLPARASPARSPAALPSHGAGSPTRSRSTSRAAAPPGSATVASGAGSRASPPRSPPEPLPRYHPPMGRLAVGLIGTGKHGQRYARHIRADVPELTLAALSRRDPARGREQARALGCRFHDDWAALVADPAVEAVIAVVPPTLHPALAAAVAAARKPFLVEKPLAPTAAAARQTVRVPSAAR